MNTTPHAALFQALQAAQQHHQLLQQQQQQQRDLAEVDLVVVPVEELELVPRPLPDAVSEPQIRLASRAKKVLKVSWDSVIPDEPTEPPSQEHDPEGHQLLKEHAARQAAQAAQAKPTPSPKGKKKKKRSTDKAAKSKAQEQAQKQKQKQKQTQTQDDDGEDVARPRTRQVITHRTVVFKRYHPWPRMVARYIVEMRDVSPSPTPMPESFEVVYEGAERSVTLKKLRPGHLYEFRVSAVMEIHHDERNPDAAGCTDAVTTLETGPSEPLVAATAATVPNQPDPVTLRSRTHDSLTLEWVPPESVGAPILEYTIEMGAGEDGIMLPAFCGSGDATFFTKDGLTPNTTYRARIFATNQAGSSLPSAVSSFRTAGTTSSAPSAPRQSSKSSHPHKISLRWDPPSQTHGLSVEKYALMMAIPVSGWEVVYEGEEPRFEITNDECDLRPNTTYQFKVQAYNSVGPSAFSSTSKIKTAPWIPEPPAPPSLEAATAHTLQLRWACPSTDNGAPVQTYTLTRVMDAGVEDGRGELLYEGPDTSFCVQGLAPATAYSFVVSATNRVGPGPASQVATFCTRPDLPGPVCASVQGVQATSARVEWNEAEAWGSAIRGYVVEVWQQQEEEQSAAEDVRKERVDGTTHQLTLTDLMPNRHFAICVSAYNGVGAGPASDPPVVFVTQMALPTAPSPPEEWQPPSMSSIFLHWGLAVEQGACKAPGADDDVDYAPNGEVLSWVLQARPAYTMDHASASGARKKKKSKGKKKGTDSSAAVAALAALEPFATLYEGERLHFVVDNLSPGQRVEVRLRRVSSVGSSNWSYPLVFGTQCTAPTAPTELSLREAAGQHLEVSWQPGVSIGTPLVRYIVEYRPAASRPAGFVRVPSRGLATSCTIKSLQPLTEYDVRVAAANAAGQSQFAVASFATGGSVPLAAPCHVRVQEVEEGLLASWRVTDKLTSTCRLQYCKQQRRGRRGEWIDVYSGPESEFLLHGRDNIDIEPGKERDITLAFRVFGANEHGEFPKPSKAARFSFGDEGDDDSDLDDEDGDDGDDGDGDSSSSSEDRDGGVQRRRKEGKGKHGTAKTTTQSASDVGKKLKDKRRRKWWQCSASTKEWAFALALPAVVILLAIWLLLSPVPHDASEAVSE